jgi:hypothetical protein
MPFFFKGNTTASWIEAAINVVGIFVFLLLSSRAALNRPSRPDGALTAKIFDAPTAKA